jgi:hypothetical protein
MSDDWNEPNFTTTDGREVYVDADGIEHPAAPNAPPAADRPLVDDNDDLNSAELRRRFEDQTKELEAQDKLGNFEIQDLMS